MKRVERSQRQEGAKSCPTSACWRLESGRREGGAYQVAGAEIVKIGGTRKWTGCKSVSRRESYFLLLVNPVSCRIKSNVEGADRDHTRTIDTDGRRR
jgi:hypothetical protein